MTSNVRRQIIGEDVPLKEIEAALQQHWRNSVEKESDQPVMKASTLNLLLFVKGETTFQRALRQVEGIIAHHPGRMILARVMPGLADDKIQAHLSACSQKTKDGQTQIAAEIIILNTGERGADRLAGAILPLLLPDVPVFFWQPDMADLSNSNFNTLLQHTDRLIVNTAAEYETLASIDAMAKSILALQKECNISDLRWSELTEWREAIAQIFDSENNLRLLDKIEDVEIEYHGDHISSHAVLMAGWLAQILDKIPRDASDHHGAVIFQKHRGGTAAIKISKTPSKALAGLNSIKLIAESKNRTTVFTAAAMKNRGIKITTQTDGSPCAESIIRPTRADDAQLLCGELDFVQQDEIYLDTLQTISELLNEK